MRKNSNFQLSVSEISTLVAATRIVYKLRTARSGLRLLHEMRVRERLAREPAQVLFDYLVGPTILAEGMLPYVLEIQEKAGVDYDAAMHWFRR